jgi:hypothetical protein
MTGDRATASGTHRPVLPKKNCSDCKKVDDGIGDERGARDRL